MKKTMTRRQALTTLFAGVAGMAVVGTTVLEAQAPRIVYVSPGDSLQAAIDAMRPGDRLILREGTYNIDDLDSLLWYVHRRTLHIHRV